MQIEGPGLQLPPTRRPKVLVWSLLVGLVAGLFGVSAPTALIGTYMETPPPFLGQPYSYQTLQSCSKLVCTPVALNNTALALEDYAIYFAVGFLVTLAAQIVFGTRRKQRRSWFGRNLVPASLFIVAALVVAVAAGGSVASGASFTQPHWPTPSGVEVYALNNATIYSGTATTASVQGTAHLDITFVNYYWKSESFPANITITAANGTVISSVYQCQTPTSCSPLKTIEIPRPYSAFTFDQPTNAFYFGSDIVRGQDYRLVLTTPILTMNLSISAA